MEADISDLSNIFGVPSSNSLVFKNKKFSKN